MKKREMKDSGIPWIGEIPKEWEVCRLKNEVTLTLGKMLMASPPQDSKNNYTAEYYLKARNVGWLSLNLNEIDKMWFNSTEKELYQLKDGDLLVTEGGEVGRIAKWKDIGQPCYIQNSVHKISPLNDVDSGFLCYWLFSLGKNDYFRSIVNTISISHLTKDKLSITPCVKVKFSEQKAIAEFLDRKCGDIDELISLQEQMIEELRAYKQSVITEAVTKGLNPNAPLKDSGIEWIGEIPEHWDVDKMFRLFGKIGSGTTPKSTDESNFLGTINWIQSGDLNGGILTHCKNQISEKTLAKYSALKVFNSPFIIIAMYGASVGNTSLSMIDGAVNQACCVLSDGKMYKDYAFAVIKSCKDYWLRKAVGGGQPNISQETIKSTWLPVPPLSEQQEIAGFLDKKCSEIDSLIALKQTKIEELKDYKKSIIYEYVTGKKEVEINEI